MKRFSFYVRTDSNQEAVGTTMAASRLAAAKYFAKQKQLDLKSFLRIFSISK